MTWEVYFRRWVRRYGKPRDFYDAMRIFDSWCSAIRENDMTFPGTTRRTHNS
jgi:hypothetical protein